MVQNYIMRFYKSLFSLLLLCLFACGNDAKPSNLIDKKQFIPLLVDVHLVDGYMGIGSQLPDSLNIRGIGLYQQVFKKYGVDSVQFKKSFQYYSRNLADMNEIYDSVVHRLTFKNDSISKYNAAQEVKRAKIRTDSLAKEAKKDSIRIAAQQDSIKKVKSSGKKSKLPAKNTTKN